MTRALAVAVLAVLAGCAGSRPAAPAPPRSAVVAAASGQDPAALVAWRDGLALGAGRTVRFVQGGAVAWEARLPGRVLALAGGDTLWAGTDAGLFALAGPTPTAVDLPGAASAVLAVAVGDGGRVWAATQRDGVWAREGGRWTASPTASPVTGVADRGGVVWMGSGLGVTRRDAAGEARFTEEGTTDHGLLDNVVDRLVATADGAVWAVHPEGVSVFSDGEPHGFRFVGRPGAGLLDVVALPAGGYVLATGRGVLWVPSLSERPDGGLRGLRRLGHGRRPRGRRGAGGAGRGPGRPPGARARRPDGLVRLALRRVVGPGRRVPRSASGRAPLAAGPASKSPGPGRPRARRREGTTGAPGPLRGR